MSAASTTTSLLTRWPHRRVLLVLLVVSLVLNVCFVAGAMWTRMRAPPAGGLEQFFPRVPAELGLDDKQRAAFERYAGAMRGRSEKLRQQVAPLLGSAWEEIAKPEANASQALRLFDEMAAKRQESQHETVVQTLEFLSTLSPDQRRKFVAMARERRGSRWSR